MRKRTKFGIMLFKIGPDFNPSNLAKEKGGKTRVDLLGAPAENVAEVLKEESRERTKAGGSAPRNSSYRVRMR
jgi:hypothetical protein